MSKANALAKNTALIAISRLSIQMVTFFMLPLYTSTLSPTEYGAVDLIITYGALLAPLIMLNVQQAVFRYLIDARSDVAEQRRIITNAVEITILMSIIAGLVYTVVGLLIDLPFAIAMAIYFISFIVGDLMLQIARGLGKIKAFAVTGIAQGLLTVLLNIVFMLPLQMGANGMLLGAALGLSIPAIMLGFHIGMHKSLRLNARNASTKKQLLGFSVPLLPNSISWWVFNASDRTVISIVLGVAANGIYAVSNKFANIANSFSAIFFTSWSEAAVLAIDEPDRDSFFSRVANIMLSTFSIIGLLIMSMTPLVFPLLVDSSFSEALLYLPLLILGTVLNTVVSFYSAIYIAKKLTKQVTNTSIVAAVINIIVNLGLIWFFGIWAAVISTVIAYGSMAVYRHFDMKKYVNIKYDKRNFVIIGIIFAMVTVVYYADNVYASLLSFVFVGVSGYWLNRKDIWHIKGLIINKVRTK